MKNEFLLPLPPQEGDNSPIEGEEVFILGPLNPEVTITALVKILLL